MLRALDVPKETIAMEMEAMMDADIAKAASCRVLGSMNDFIFTLGSYTGAGSLLEECLRLAETPCGPLRMSSVPGRNHSSVRLGLE
jgi:hypothetical protein